MLVAQLSDIHTGGARFDPSLLEMAISEINASEPDLVVVARDVTDELRVPVGAAQSLGEYPRDWPPALSARAVDPLALSTPGPKLAND